MNFEQLDSNELYAAAPAIRAYREALPAGRLVGFPLTGMDRVGVPYWSLTLYPHDAPVNAGSGFGTLDAEALTGAFGELTEVVAANHAVRRMERVRGSYQQMLKRNGARGVVNPLTLCLEAGQPYSAARELQWVACRRYSTAEQVFVPIEFIACQSADLERGDWLITLITNGLGAGLAREHAIAHGLLELLQRDGNSVRFRVLATDVGVELDEIEDEETCRLLAHLRAQGIDITIKLAGTDFDMVNLYIVGSDQAEASGIHPIAAFACGEAVHPNREVALRKALLEFAAARARLAFSHGPLAPVARVAPPGYLAEYFAHYHPAGEEPRARDTMLALYRRTLPELRALLAERVTRVRRTIRFSQLPTVSDERLTSDRSLLAAEISKRLTDAGHDILVADFHATDSPVQAVKVIVPGLEVETMSYDRIGARNAQRLFDDGSDLIGHGDPPPGAARVWLTSEAEAQFGGPIWFNTRAAHAQVGLLYALYREPGRHATALVSDHAGRYEAARDEQLVTH